MVGAVVESNVRLSPLSRGRGLKLAGGVDAGGERKLVAPLAGAWIETVFDCGPDQRARPSPLSRGRGLKLRTDKVLIADDLSPLSRGRGLKHCRWMGGRDILRSPLSRGRGLKLYVPLGLDRQAVSPLSRGRGLKPKCPHDPKRRDPVAPLAGAWIET